MAIADLIILFLTLFSSLLGLSRGFIKEFLSLTKWLLSLYIAFISFEKTRNILSQFLKDSAILDLVAGSLIFLLIFIFLSIIFNFLSKIISIKSLNFLDKTLGFLFGLLRIILILSLVTIIYNDVFYNEKKPYWVDNSFSIQYIEKISIYLKKEFLNFNLNDDIIT